MKAASDDDLAQCQERIAELLERLSETQVRLLQAETRRARDEVAFRWIVTWADEIADSQGSEWPHLPGCREGADGVSGCPLCMIVTAAEACSAS